MGARPYRGVSGTNGRPAIQKSPFRGAKGPNQGANCQPSPQPKTLTKGSSRERGEKTSTKRSPHQCQFWATKSRPDLATTSGHFKKRKKRNVPKSVPILDAKKGVGSGRFPNLKLSIFRAVDFAGFRSGLATTQQSVRTLPSRAHPQDYGR